MPLNVPAACMAGSGVSPCSSQGSPVTAQGPGTHSLLAGKHCHSRLGDKPGEQGLRNRQLLQPSPWAVPCNEVCEANLKFQYRKLCLCAGVAIDGNNNEVKERHIQLVKKRGNVKALDEELYSKCKAREPKQ